MRISDWRSYVCSSDLLGVRRGGLDESTNSPDRDLLWIADPLDITSSGARKVGGPGRVRAACQQRQANSSFSPKDQRRLTVYRRNVRAERRVDRSCTAQHTILPGGTPATPSKSVDRNSTRLNSSH